MINLDLASATAGQIAASKVGERDALAAAAVLRVHGVYAMFSFCRSAQLESLEESATSLLRSQEITVTSKDNLPAIDGWHDLKRAHMLLTRFLDYIYVYAHGRTK